MLKKSQIQFRLQAGSYAKEFSSSFSSSLYSSFAQAIFRQVKISKITGGLALKKKGCLTAKKAAGC